MKNDIEVYRTYIFTKKDFIEKLGLKGVIDKVEYEGEQIIVGTLSEEDYE